MGLRARLLWVVLMPVIPALLLALYTNFEQRRFGMFKVETDAVREAQLVAASQVSMIEATRQHLEGLARFPEARGTNTSGFDPFFKRLQTIYPQYVDFGAIEADGEVIAGGWKRNGITNAADRPIIQRVLKNKDFSVGNYQPARGDMKPSVVFANPILNEDGGIMRVAYAALDLSLIQRAVAKARLPQGGIINVIDLDGDIAAGFPEPEKWVGKRVEGSSFLETMEVRGQGTAVLKGPDGQRRFYAFTTVRAGRNPGLYLAVGLPLELAYREPRRILIRNVTILALVALIALAASQLYAKSQVIQPIESLLGATKRLTEGDLTARTGAPRGRGELQQLSRAFDAMAEGIEKDRVEIERSHLALQESEERARLILDNALDGVITLNSKGVVTGWNKEAEKIFGWNAADMLGRSLVDCLVPPQHRSNAPKWIEEIAGNANSQLLNKRLEFSAVRRNGEEFPVELAITPIPLKEHLVFSIFVRDITERKEAERKIRAWNASLEERVTERTRQLEAANRELEAFSVSVSHDLRAPLRQIGSFVEILQRDNSSTLSETGKKHFDVISRKAQQMASLIDDLLEFSRTTRVEMTPEPENMNELVKEVIRELGEAASRPNLQWEIGDLPTVMGDRPLLKQVWVNLLSNAVKYTQKVLNPMIKIRGGKNSANEFEFAVEDNGAGFDMKHVGKLFGVFERLHDAGEFSGTGIGLAIVKRIVARHGGRVWAHGEAGKGATFYFTLPVEPVAQSRGNGVPAARAS